MESLNRAALPKDPDVAPLQLARRMPQNADMEAAVIGAVLQDNTALEQITDTLEEQMFSVPVLGRVFAAIKTLSDRSQAADPVTLSVYFRDDPDFAGYDVQTYLAELSNAVYTVVNIGDYATQIRELFLRRTLIRIGGDMVNDAYDTSDATRTPDDCLESAESELFKLADKGQGANAAVPIRSALQVALQIAEKARKADGNVTGVTTGLVDLDGKLGGLHSSDLLILAGRPSMGKTALATIIAFNAAKAYAESGGQRGAQVGFFSLEMSSDQLATRLLGHMAEISGDHIRKGQINNDQFDRLTDSSHTLSRYPLYIDDTPAISISSLRTRARRLKRQHGLGLIVVDYLQLMRGSSNKQNEASRVNEVSEITRGLKAIAKELQVPVIALSQLSRAVEQRPDKRPQLADLRESGSIEQDADVVMFVYREEYYLGRETPNPNDSPEKMEKWQKRFADAKDLAEVIIAKQRHGPIGIVPMYFVGQYTRFDDISVRQAKTGLVYHDYGDRE